MALPKSMAKKLIIIITNVDHFVLSFELTTISSVNSGTNAVYYEDNQGGTDVCINGYTVPFTAEYAVQCGATYHIKLAIADGSDTALESIVVLEEGSFSSNAFDLVASASVSGNQIFLGDTTVVESCNNAIFKIIRPSATTEDTLNVTISGTATNGVDYETIDPEVIMLVGQYIYDLPLNVYADAEASSHSWAIRSALANAHIFNT